MELTMTRVDNDDSQPRKDGAKEASSGSAQNNEAIDANAVASFVSASHEFASEQFIKGMELNDDKLMIKSEQVAQSMGQSGLYKGNPFRSEDLDTLSQAFEKGVKAQERIMEESRIAGDDKELEQDQ